MLQVLQHLESGKLELADVPAPGPRPGHLLIQARHSLISAGTERMLIEFARANLLQKALQQPEKVKQVLDKIRADGLLPAIDAVWARLSEALPLGYSSAGVVLEAGEGISDIRPGDLVASNAPHAEVACVPAHLAAKIPGGVPTRDAAFTVLGAVALHGVRLLEPALGETFLVIGLGLVGQLAVQILRANGCRVLGTDPVEERRKLADGSGARTAPVASLRELLDFVEAETGGRFADGVLIAASTASNEPIEQAAAACRKRGRIVLTGAIGLQVPRGPFYEKELSFRVSCSYGPGRYDPAYETGGQDYPLPYVRWTEQRNFEAVLGLMESGGLQVAKLVSRVYGLQDARAAYDDLASAPGPLGILLEYPAGEPRSFSRTVRLAAPTGRPAAREVSIGLIGAGQYGRGTLLPALARTGARLRAIASRGGAPAAAAARRYGFETATTDWETLLGDPEVTALVIATPHHLHAPMAAAALSAGKDVYVEKPVAIDLDGLRQVAAARTRRVLAAGFNRRFAPHTVRMKQLLSERRRPLAAVVTVNAGALPADHWLRDPCTGGGRLIGEACHWLDLLGYLTGSRWRRVRAAALDGDIESASIQLEYEDGSIGTVHYLANGDRSFPKERIELFWDGRILALDNFRVLHGHGVPGFSRMALWRQDKGHAAATAAFVDAARTGGPSPFAFDDLLDTTLCSLAAAESAASGRTVDASEMWSRLDAAKG